MLRCQLLAELTDCYQTLALDIVASLVLPLLDWNSPASRVEKCAIAASVSSYQTVPMIIRLTSVHETLVIWTVSFLALCSGLMNPQYRYVKCPKDGCSHEVCRSTGSGLAGFHCLLGTKYEWSICYHSRHSLLFITLYVFYCISNVLACPMLQYHCVKHIIILSN